MKISNLSYQRMGELSTNVLEDLYLTNKKSFIQAFFGFERMFALIGVAAVSFGWILSGATRCDLKTASILNVLLRLLAEHEYVLAGFISLFYFALPIGLFGYVVWWTWSWISDRRSSIFSNNLTLLIKEVKERKEQERIAQENKEKTVREIIAMTRKTLQEKGVNENDFWSQFRTEWFAK